ncbi:uncharacterized protein LOC128232549 [Mya arenaria]|uniref:uncharacterized protein LOC128232549 n=1 Tax=Mya arenaria TaxID=6604 RepID=UPI0022E08651|nr:uncharacterized protein LOC128232549 [Mya arenaria]
MSRVLHTSGFLLPPPKYSEALRYPKPDSFTTSPRQFNCQSVVNISDETYLFSNSSDPAEIPYTNLDSHNHSHGDTFGSKLKINACKKCNDGKPLIPLEAIPETLASSGGNCVEKTYAQLEVVAAGHTSFTTLKEGDTKAEVRAKNDCNSKELASQAMCGVGARDGCEGLAEVMGGMNHCREVASANAKVMPVPLNGMITPDKMMVETLLSEMSEINNDSLLVNGDIEDMNGDISDLDDFDNDLPPPPREVLEMECSMEPEAQTEHDLHDLAQVLSREATERRDSDSGSSEHAPLLQQPPDAQSNYPKDTFDENVDESIKYKRKVDNGHEYAESGYTESSQMEFREHLFNKSNDHAVDTVVYSEPEFSSSDISIKKSGGSPKSAIDMCQRTLKRTNNGMDHTVYELSPSESFCYSADNVQDDSKRLQEHSSNEAICRIGRSSSSLTEPTKKRQPLSRDTSVSFKKPLVVGPRGGERASVRVDMQPRDGEVEPADGEPLVTPNTHNSITSIPSNINLEDSRTYYKRKAADRGTLYCAIGGITVVAIIVFLLIYFA